MINLDLVGNGQGLHYGKRNTFYCFMFILGTYGVVFSNGIERKSTCKILNIFYYHLYHFEIVFFKYIIFSHKRFYINFS